MSMDFLAPYLFREALLITNKNRKIQDFIKISVITGEGTDTQEINQGFYDDIALQM